MKVYCIMLVFGWLAIQTQAMAKQSLPAKLKSMVTPKLVIAAAAISFERCGIGSASTTARFSL